MAEPAAERVNCRRVVFHPYCRGISAKRSSMQLKDASDMPPSLESIKKSLPKIWQQLLIPDTRQRIIERFNSEQSIPRTMKAVIVDDNNSADTNHSEPNPKLDSHLNHEFRAEPFQVPPYLFGHKQSNIEPDIKSTSSEEEISETNPLIFHLRMVSYPEFMQFFSRLTSIPKHSML
ncbi:hypothetical protein HUG17_5479 [Dermatophagoides farinae]|nr:hypothetical protein HUG17_5479 [Dermatophagoides farinae]